MLISTVSQILGTIINAVLAVVVLRISTKHLGPHHYGQLVTVITFVTICATVTDLGLNGLTVRNLAKFPERAGEIIGDNLAARGLLCFLAAPVMVGLGYVIYPNERGTVALGIALLSIDVLFGAVSSTYLIWYSSRIRNDVLAIISLLNKLIYTGGVAVAAALDASLFGYLGATLLADAVTVGLSWRLVRRQVHVRLRLTPRAWQRNMAGSMTLGIMQIAGTIFLWIDKFLNLRLSWAEERGFLRNSLRCYCYAQLFCW